MTDMFKRCAAVILSFVMIFGVIPGTVLKTDAAGASDLLNEDFTSDPFSGCSGSWANNDVLNGGGWKWDDSSSTDTPVGFHAARGSVYAEEGDCRLNSPMVKFTNTGNLTLTFWTSGTDPDSNEEMKVGVVYLAPDKSTVYSPVRTVSVEGDAEQRHVLDLTSFVPELSGRADDEFAVYFLYTDCTKGLWIDDVKITVTPYESRAIITGDAARLILEGAQHSFVWYGKYPQSSDGAGGYNTDPIKWRVLENADGRLFVLSDLVLEQRQYHTDEDEAVTWEGSTMRSWLNGYDASHNIGDEGGDLSVNAGIDYSGDGDSFRNAAFTGREFDALAVSHVVTADNPDYNTEGGDPTDDRLFLLSLDEMKNAAYGFTNDDSRVPEGTWWFYRVFNYSIVNWKQDGCVFLRTPGYYQKSSSVYRPSSSLSTYGQMSFNPGGVRPAMRIDLSKVLFASSANGKKASGTLSEVAAYTGTEWKLTVLDETRAGFDASLVSYSGGKAVISYSGAVVGEYVSAVILNHGEIKYYGTITSPAEESGEFTLDLNGKFGEDDVLCVFSEQKNDGMLTDCASALVDVTPAAGELDSSVSVAITSDYEKRYGGLPSYRLESGSPGQTQIFPTTGDIITYTVTITSTGEDDAKNVVMNIEVSPWGDQFTFLSGDLQHKFPLVKSGEPVAVTYHFRVTDLFVPGTDIVIKATARCNGMTESAQETNTLKYLYSILTSAEPAEGGTITAPLLGVEGEQTITYAPKAGYRLESLELDGQALSVSDYPESYTFAEVEKDHVLKAVFAEAYELTDVSVRQTGTLTYNGREQTAAVTASAAAEGGRSVTFTYSAAQSEAYMTTVPAFTDAGEHTVYYKASAADHNDASGSFQVTVLPASVTVKADDKEKTVGETNPAFTATVTGMVNNENENLIKYGFEELTAETVKTYAITPTGDKEQGNYTVTFEPGTLTVKEADKEDLNKALDDAKTLLDEIKDKYGDEIPEELEDVIKELEDAIEQAEQTVDQNTPADVVEKNKEAVEKAREDAENRNDFREAKDEAKDDADELSKPGDSEDAEELIEEAKKAIEDLGYDGTKTPEENQAAIDEILTQLEKDLKEQRENDFEDAKDEAQQSADALAQPGDSEEVEGLIEEAKSAVENLSYDGDKTPADHQAAIDEILTQLEKDLKEQRENDFEDAKDEAQQSADALAQPGDSEEAEKLIEEAKSAVENLGYDDTKTPEENQASIDEILEQLEEYLEAQRNKEEREEQERERAEAKLRAMIESIRRAAEALRRRQALERQGEIPPTEDELPFRDVCKTDSFYDDVKFVYKNEIMNGVSEVLFDPSGTLTRGMIVTILWRMEGKPDVAGTGTFTDVPAGEWYADGVEWAALQGIVLGYGNGEYGPNDPVTREQLALILFRWAKGEGRGLVPNAEYAPAAVAGASDWAAEAVAWAAADGILTADENGDFRPGQPASRAEIASALRPLLEKR